MDHHLSIYDSFGGNPASHGPHATSASKQGNQGSHVNTGDGNVQLETSGQFRQAVVMPDDNMSIPSGNTYASNVGSGPTHIRNGPDNSTYLPGQQHYLKHGHRPPLGVYEPVHQPNMNYRRDQQMQNFGGKHSPVMSANDHYPATGVPVPHVPYGNQQQQQQGSFALLSDSSSLSIGAKVNVELTSGDVMSGEVFLVDHTHLHCIILREEAGTRKANFHIIQMRAISSIAVSQQPSGSYDMSLPLCDLSVLERRERQAIQEFEKKRPSIGINVTKEAQDIYDFIHKTHPKCSWADNGDIIVMGNTRVLYPSYEHCTGTDDKLVRRLREVLKKFRLRREKENQKRTAVPIIQYSAAHTSPPISPTQSSGTEESSMK